MSKLTKPLLGVLAGGLVACGAAVVGHAADRPAAGSTAAAPGGVAVVELFTSQGCSSCPPAESELGRINAAATRDHRPVITLAYHVDYWDRLGWRDPFSTAAASARQSAYASAFHSERVYTPQMVVNGTTEFVGSDSAAATKAIDAAAATSAAVPVTVAGVTKGGGGYVVKYTAGPADGKLVATVAVVEQGLSTKVERGENGGRTLDQPSVVRWFTTVPAERSGTVTVRPPAGVDPAHAAVVVYVQRPADLAVVGAATAPLP